MDQQPKIPTLKDAQKPQVKIKGMGAGLTLFDRLKQFKKKDLAFILAGLGTLFMAPLAEHFMMAPENGASDMASGFRGPGGSGGNLFGSGSSPYESGNNGIAQGGAIGGAGDIITPLNVRDPSALVMGPGQAQQPPAGSMAPTAPPPTASASSSDDLKDALKAGAINGASAALKKAPLPVPKVALGGSGLRGLGVAGGGTSASGSLGPINSGNLGQAGTGGGGLNLVRGAPGYKGVSGARGPGNPTGLDGTKKAGQNAGDAFSRTGSALSGLNAAASEQIPTGASGYGGGGQGGAGANDKGPGGGGPPGSKSVGESLAFIEAKERMMENLKLEFEKRKLKDPELLLYGIRNDSLKAMASEVTKSLTKAALGFLDPSAPASGSYWECLPGYPKISAATASCDEKKTFDCMTKIQGADHYQTSPGVTTKCVSKNGAGSTPKPAAETAPSSAGGVLAGMPTGEGATAAAKLDEFCKLLDTTIAHKNTTPVEKKAAEDIRTQVGLMVSKRDALYGTSTANSCGATDVRKGKSVYEYQGLVVARLLAEKGVPGLIKTAADPKGVVDDSAVVEARANYDKAVARLQEANNIVIDAQKLDTKGIVDTEGKFRGLIDNAKAAKQGIDTYAADEQALLEKRLNPLLQGAEYAGDKKQTPSVPVVVQENAAFKALEARAKGVGLTPAATEPPAAAAPAPGAAAPPKPDPKAEYDAVMETAKSAKSSVAAADSPVAVLENKTEAERTPAMKSEAQKAIDAAATATGGMLKKQAQVLGDINGGLTDMKNGVAAAAPGT